MLHLHQQKENAEIKLLSFQEIIQQCEKTRYNFHRL